MKTQQFAQRINNLEASPIREILKVIDRPGMISFAGGLPSPDSFPKLSGDIPSKYLQYGPSEGEPELRSVVAEMLSKRGLECDSEQVLILSGSQQGIDLVSKLLIEKNSKVGIEFPTYLAALQVMGMYGADYQSINSINKATRVAYIIPTFQNPTGHCYSENERLYVAELCDRTDTILFEDDPYSDLVYDEVCRNPVCSMLKDASWIYQGSFSKSLSPGLRLGYMVCSKELIPYLTRLKQAADLHSNRISQYFVLQALTDSQYDCRLDTLRSRYKKKRDFFDESLKKHFNDTAIWQPPPGGLFFWLTLKQEITITSADLFQQAIEKNVAFMPGEYFYPRNASQPNQLRLNFSHADEDQIVRGLAILAELTNQDS